MDKIFHLLPEWLAFVGLWVGLAALAFIGVRYLRPKQDDTFKKWGL